MMMFRVTTMTIDFIRALQHMIIIVFIFVESYFLSSAVNIVDIYILLGPHLM